LKQKSSSHNTFFPIKKGVTTKEQWFFVTIIGVLHAAKSWSHRIKGLQHMLPEVISFDVIKNCQTTYPVMKPLDLMYHH
jgi:hypothetical protein